MVSRIPKSAVQATRTIRGVDDLLSQLPPRTPGLHNLTAGAVLSSGTTPKRLRIARLIDRVPPVPPYPYEPARWYKKSNRGLFGGQTIQFGNNVGGRIPVKTRRTWHPNVQSKRLWSESMESFVKVMCTTRVIRTVDKCGGLDNYLLGSKSARIKELGPVGWQLRWHVQNSVMQREKTARRNLERAGIEPVGLEELTLEEEQREGEEAEVADLIDSLEDDEDEHDAILGEKT